MINTLWGYLYTLECSYLQTTDHIPTYDHNIYIFIRQMTIAIGIYNINLYK